MKIYIISLNTATNRRDFQKQQLEKIGLTNYEFFNAVNINDIDDTILKKHNNDWKHPLTLTEIATYYSHQALWQKVIKNNQPALILEDDALLSKQIPNFLLKITNLNKNIDLINLEIQHKMKRLSKIFITITDYFKIFQIYQGRVGAAGYILYPSGAKKLLEQEQKGIAPADVYITNCHHLYNYQAEPALAIQLENCHKYNIITPIDTKSSIKRSKSKPSFKKLFYQLKRMFYYVKFIHHRKRHILIKNTDFI